MGINYRCSKYGCRKRVKLSKKKEQYRKGTVLCPSCKNDSLFIDKSVKRDSKKNTCNCDGFPWPHKAKSISGNFICKKVTDWELMNYELGARKINSRIKEPI
jgi:hypothetical protein